MVRSLIWLEAEELVKVNLANNPITYNNMFEQGWRLPTFFELFEAVRQGLKLQQNCTYATSESFLENNKIIYVCLTMQKNVPRKILISVDNLYVYAKLCIDKQPTNQQLETTNIQKIIVPSEENPKNLKCCGNCMYFSLSGYCCNPTKVKKFYKTYAKGVCVDWEFDSRNYLSFSESGESRINLHDQYMNEKIDKLTQHELQFFLYIKKNKSKEDLF